jgi:hypothetical protein
MNKHPGKRKAALITLKEYIAYGSDKVVNSLEEQNEVIDSEHEEIENDSSDSKETVCVVVFIVSLAESGHIKKRGFGRYYFTTSLNE